MKILFKSFDMQKCLLFCNKNTEKYPNLLIEKDIFSGVYQVINLD